MFNRRGFIVAAAAAGLAERSIASVPPTGVGYLHPVTLGPGHITFDLVHGRLRTLGYAPGSTLFARSADREPSRLPQLTGELIDAGCRVIVAVGADAVRAAYEHPARIQVVAIDLETDPVAAGLIEKHGRPGGRVTGLFFDLPAVAEKWIELAHALVPELRRVVFAWQPSAGRAQLDLAVAAARRFGMEVEVLPLDTCDDFHEKFKALGDRRDKVLIQLTFPGLQTVAKAYADAAIRNRLPTITVLRLTAQRGTLASYGPRQESWFPRAADIADMIIKGTPAAEIPIERPIEFELILNIATARALSLDIPPAVLVRATELIE
jgi:putative ABC transport system substrate-binding protein